MSMFGPHSGNRERLLLIELRSPWENGYSESFNGKLRDELLDREIFYKLREAQVLIEGWRQRYTPCGRTTSSVSAPYPATRAISTLTPQPPPALAFGTGLN